MTPAWSSRSCPSFSTPATASAPTLGRTVRRRKAPRFRISASAAGSGGWDRRGFRRARGAASLRFARLLLARRRRPHLSQAQPGVLGTFSIPPREGAAGRVDALGPGRLRHLRRHDLSQGLELTIGIASTWPWCRPPGPTSRIEIRAAGTGCLATSARSPARFRRRSRWISASRSIFANQCGETRTTIPVLGTQIRDRFAGQSSICDGRHGEPVRAGREPSLLIAPITIHQQRGLKSWRSTSPSAPAASCSESALS